MCLLVFAWHRVPGYSLVFAGNRDELHAREAAAAQWWGDDVLAGRDLQAGGTWLGVNTAGRFAVVTNFHDRDARAPGQRSRGELVTGFLTASLPAGGYLDSIEADAYAGFNLIAGDANELWYFSNRGPQPRALAPGIYGLSNELLDTPSPRLTHARERFAALTDGAWTEETLFGLLTDTAPGNGEAPFIVNDTYGTRACTVVTHSAHGRMRFSERSFGPSGRALGAAQFGFGTGGAQ